jgi:hypothetical protein
LYNSSYELGRRWGSSNACNLIAAALKTCKVARHLCFEHNITTTSYLSDIYLENVVSKLWDLWKSAGGVRISRWLSHQIRIDPFQPVCKGKGKDVGSTVPDNKTPDPQPSMTMTTQPTASGKSTSPLPSDSNAPGSGIQNQILPDDNDKDQAAERSTAGLKIELEGLLKVISGLLEVS